MWKELRGKCRIWSIPSGRTTQINCIDVPDRTENDGCPLSHCHGPIFALLTTLKQKILLSLTQCPLYRFTESWFIKEGILADRVNQFHRYRLEKDGREKWQWSERERERGVSQEYISRNKESKSQRRLLATRQSQINPNSRVLSLSCINKTKDYVKETQRKMDERTPGRFEVSQSQMGWNVTFRSLILLSLWYDTKVTVGCEVDRAVSGERSWKGSAGSRAGRDGIQISLTHFEMEPQSWKLLLKDCDHRVSSDLEDRWGGREGWAAWKREIWALDGTLEIRSRPPATTSLTLTICEIYKS